MPSMPMAANLEMTFMGLQPSADRLSQREPLIDQRREDPQASSPLAPVSPIYHPHDSPTERPTAAPGLSHDDNHSSRGDFDPDQQDSHPRTIWDRVGMTASIILVGGTIVLFGSIGFLVYLWVEAKRAISDQSLTSMWKAIAQADWITQSVTITAAVMRTVMAAQTALTTAMIAALYLESFGTRLRHLPLLSMMRTVTVSPLVFIASGSLVFSSSSSRALASGMVIATSLLAAMVQLMSTILVSDIAVSTIPTNLQTGPVISHGLSSSESKNYYLNQPAESYWRFAEWRGETGGQTVQETTDFTDTGETLRASLPWLDEKSRTSLQSFTGESLIWDARVVCFSPNISKTEPSITGQTISLRVDFSIDKRLPWYAWSERFREYSSLGDVECEFSSNIAGVFLCNSVFEDALAGVLRFDGNERIADPIKNNVLGGNTSQGWTAQKNGPWLQLLDETGQAPLSLSVCITNSDLGIAEVVTHGAPATSEPVLNKRGLKGLTEQVRHQLGVLGLPDAESYRDRGILALSAPPSGSRRWRGPWGVFMSAGPLEFSLRQEPGFMPAPSVHWSHSALFTDILHFTNNPALAVQSLATVLNQMSFFDRYPTEFRNTNASYISSQDAKIPVRNVGLIIVVGLVTAHIILVAFVSQLFLARTRSTLLGNAWQSIAQVVSERTYETLQAADSLKDGEVEKILGKLELDQVGVIRRRSNGRQEFGPQEES